MKKPRIRKVQAEMVWAYMKYRGPDKWAASRIMGHLKRHYIKHVIEVNSRELAARGASREQAEAAIGDWLVRQVIGGENLKSLGWDTESSFQRRAELPKDDTANGANVDNQSTQLLASETGASVEHKECESKLEPVCSASTQTEPKWLLDESSGTFQRLTGGIVYKVGQWRWVRGTEPWGIAIETEPFIWVEDSDIQIKKSEGNCITAEKIPDSEMSNVLSDSCSKCGSINAAEASYCNNCGNSLSTPPSIEGLIHQPTITSLELDGAFQTPSIPDHPEQSMGESGLVGLDKKTSQFSDEGTSKESSRSNDKQSWDRWILGPILAALIISLSVSVVFTGSFRPGVLVLLERLVLALVCALITWLIMRVAASDSKRVHYARHFAIWYFVCVLYGVFLSN